MRRDPFRPSRDGFAFPNAFSVPGAAFGLGVPMLPTFGLGAGMAWLALDWYLAGRVVPALAEPPVATDPLHAELVKRQANALAATSWNRLIEWQCLPDGGLVDRPGLAESSRAHWRRARESLDAGVPVLLFLIRANGRHANPSSNKAVLAVGYDLERRKRRATVLVYDPDRPGNDSVRLVFRTGRSAPLDARLAADTPVRGFFTVPYDRPQPAVLSLGSAAADGRLVDAILASCPPDRAGGPMECIARERTGKLLRIRRDRRGRWSSEHVDARVGAPRVVAEPGAVAPLDRDRIIARGASGDLLDFRRFPFLGWRGRSVTAARGIGESFRIEGSLATLRRWDASVTVVARGRAGLVRYRRPAVGRWKADRLTPESLGKVALAGAPAVVELEHRIHVLCRSESGELMHLRRRGRAGWIAENVTVRAGGRARFAVTDDPVVLKDAARRCLNVVARSAAGDVLLFRWTERAGWRGIEPCKAARASGSPLPAALAPLSAAQDDDGTVHVAARDAHGGLIHVWHARTGGSGAEEVTRTRAGIGERGRVDGAPLLVAGPAGALHVFARQDGDLLVFRWTPVGDWTLEHVRRERRSWLVSAVVGDPVLASTRGAAHLAFTDDAGRLHHGCIAVPAGAWTGRVRRTLVDWIANLGAAALRPFGLAAALIPGLASAFDRARRELTGAGTRTAAAPPLEAAGMGARFVRRAPRPAAPTRATPTRATPTPATMPATPRPAAPSAMVVRPASPPRPAAASVAAAVPPPNRNPAERKPAANPALEGLPLLADGGAGASPRPGVAPAAEAARAAPVDRPAPTGARERLELERIMALAEESKPQLL